MSFISDSSNQKKGSIIFNKNKGCSGITDAKTTLIEDQDEDHTIIDNHLGTTVSAFGGEYLEGPQGKQGFRGYRGYTGEQGKKGDKGDQGEKGATGEGIQGQQGETGAIQYTWVKYSDSITPSMEEMFETANDLTYVGIAYNKELAEGKGHPDEFDYTIYQWSQIKGTDGGDGLDGIDGERGEQGPSGKGFNWIGEHPTHPTEESYGRPIEDGDTYLNTTDGKVYTYAGGWHVMIQSGGEGPQGPQGAAGGGFQYQGAHPSAPAGALTNWLYLNTNDKHYYLYADAAWILAISDGKEGTEGATTGDGEYFFVTYSDSEEEPSKPITDGDSNGWNPSASSFEPGTIKWACQKKSIDSVYGVWSNPVDISNSSFRGPTGFRGSQSIMIPIVDWDGIWRDEVANSACTGGAPQEWDIVTMYKSSDPAIQITKRWDYNDQAKIHEWLDYNYAFLGDVLIDGTLDANKLKAQSIEGGHIKASTTLVVGEKNTYTDSLLESAINIGKHSIFHSNEEYGYTQGVKYLYKITYIYGYLPNYTFESNLSNLDKGQVALQQGTVGSMVTDAIGEFDYKVVGLYSTISSWLQYAPGIDYPTRTGHTDHAYELNRGDAALDKSYLELDLKGHPVSSVGETLYVATDYKNMTFNFEKMIGSVAVFSSDLVLGAEYSDLDDIESFVYISTSTEIFNEANYAPEPVVYVNGDDTISDKRIWVGSANPEAALFSVDSYGRLKARDVSLTGSVYAEDGYFNGSVSGAEFSGAVINGTEMNANLFQAGTIIASTIYASDTEILADPNDDNSPTYYDNYPSIPVSVLKEVVGGSSAKLTESIPAYQTQFLLSAGDTRGEPDQRRAKTYTIPADTIKLDYSSGGVKGKTKASGYIKDQVDASNPLICFRSINPHTGEVILESFVEVPRNVKTENYYSKGVISTVFDNTPFDISWSFYYYLRRQMTNDNHLTWRFRYDYIRVRNQQTNNYSRSENIIQISMIHPPQYEMYQSDTPEKITEWYKYNVNTSLYLNNKE